MQSGRAPAPERQASELVRIWLVPLLVGLGAYCVALAGAQALLNDGDTLSHIAIGRWIIAHRAIPFHDPYSYTFRDRVWVPHEWLAEVVFAAVYDRLGWGGVIAATGLSVAAAFALLTRALATTLGQRRAAIGALIAFFLTEMHLLARPHALALPLLVIWMAGVIRARDAGRVPSLALLPVMVLWCNLHGGFVVGLLFAGLLAGEAVLQAVGRRPGPDDRRLGRLSRPGGAQRIAFAERDQPVRAAVRDAADELCDRVDLGVARRRLHPFRPDRGMARAGDTGRLFARPQAPLAADLCWYCCCSTWR